MTVADDLLTGLVAAGVHLRGEDGDKGDKGDRGDKGEKGDKGNKGDAGADGVGPDEKVKLNASDPKSGFLEEKLEAGRGIYLIKKTGVNGDKLVIEVPTTRAVMGVGGNGSSSGGGAPSGPAGGDLSGTYPNPSVVDDSHSHTGATITGVSGLPPQWTDGGNGDVTAETDDDTTPFTIIAPESGSDGPFALRINPAGPAWTGAIFVETGDVGGLMGNAYVLRVFDSVAGEQVFDLDAWGSMSLKGANASLQMYGAAPTHPEVLRALGTGEFKVLSYDTAPQIVLLSVDGRTGVNEVGFFGEQAAQQTIDAPNATPEQIANILIAYGLAVQSP